MRKILNRGFACFSLYVALAGIYIYPFHKIFAVDSPKNEEFINEGVWDANFLINHPVIFEKLRDYQEGKLCKDLKELNTRILTYPEIRKILKKLGYKCFKRPLAADPDVTSPLYLKKDGTTTLDKNEAGVAWQKICVKDECVVRMKIDGFPGNRRSQPHSTKAVLLKSDEDSGSYENEAFKITSEGNPVPKGPDARFGLGSCPFKQDTQCIAWINKIMQVAHPDLKNP